MKVKIVLTQEFEVFQKELENDYGCDSFDQLKEHIRENPEDYFDPIDTTDYKVTFED